MQSVYSATLLAIIQKFNKSDENKMVDILQIAFSNGVTLLK